MKKISATIVVVAVVGLVWLLAPSAASTDINADLTADPDNGLVMLQASGCLACHSEEDNQEYAGGLKLDSPFGNFFSPNITRHPDFGIGKWSLDDFALAVRQGISPEGKYYYPVMPFTSYQGITDQDIVDMWAALQQLPESQQPNKNHEMNFPFNQRVLLKGWRLLFFKDHRVNSDNRGAYLAEHILHCGECHTPRNKLGGLINSKHYQGNDLLPDDNAAPDIRSQTLLDENWGPVDLKYFFDVGMLPDGDYVGGSMTEVIDFGSSKLSDEDREHLVNYLLNEQ